MCPSRCCGPLSARHLTAGHGSRISPITYRSCDPPRKRMHHRLESNFIPEPNSGCWLWLGTVATNGYGKLWVDGKSVSAHVLSYRLYRGGSGGKKLHHICKVKTCINPDHLLVVTTKEHSELHRDDLVIQTHCKRGHTFTSENTLIKSSGRRECRACKQQRNRLSNPKR